MRFSVELSLENDKIPKDKNRLILSLLKEMYSTYDSEYYEKLYKETPNKIKNFTFSLYLGNCKFLKEEILIPNKKIILNFSAYDYEDAIMFYNSFLAYKGKEHKISNNVLTIGKIRLDKEKPIYEDEVIFKTKSPIVVRKHKSDNKKTWYHSLESDAGQDIFIHNLRFQLLDYFGQDRSLDIEEIKFEVLKNKEVKIKHYGIEILSNICTLELKGKPYLLDYIYKAGLGSKKSGGFGMLEII